MADYYISTSGNDHNDGLSPENAWATINRANITLVAGDTVYVRGGTYREQTSGQGGRWSIISPSNSGAPGNYITYQNYNGESVVIESPAGETINAINLEDRSYIRIAGLETGHTSSWVRMVATGGNNCSHNIVQVCMFDGADVGGGPWCGVGLGSADGENLGTVEYNQILDCNFINGDCMPCDIIYFVEGNVRYNLIQGCFIDGGSHDAVDMQYGDTGNIEYNIIRRCIIRNKNHVGVNIYFNSDRNMVEDCLIFDCGSDYENNTCGTQEDRERPRFNHASIGIGSKYTIVRRNRLYNNGAFHLVSGMSYSEASNNRIYHNTFYDEQDRTVYMESSGLDCNDNIFKNNIFSKGGYCFYHNVEVGNRDNKVISNCIHNHPSDNFWDDIGGHTVADMESNYPLLWHGNIISDPMLTDPENQDFTLREDSPCIDAGDWLTTIISPDGTGDSFMVEDASYFCDGWNIIPGDVIQLEGQTQTARITNIDYVSNTITVDTSISWNAGDGIALAYNGNAPDMGAYEYTEGGIMPTHTIDLTLNIEAAPSFDGLSSIPTEQTVEQNGSVDYIISVLYSGNYNSQVDLSVSGLPADTTAVFNPPQILPTESSVLTVTPGPASPIGSGHVFQVIGTGP